MKNAYGFDDLSRDVLILSAALGLISLPFYRSVAGLILSAASTFLIILILFRTLSQNIERRQDELIGYRQITQNVASFFGGRFKKNEAKNPAYKYFNCPQCGKRYRAPKGKGRIKVTCSSCGKQFEKRV